MENCFKVLDPDIRRIIEAIAASPLAKNGQAGLALLVAACFLGVTAEICAECDPDFGALSKLEQCRVLSEKIGDAYLVLQT